jgi:hypothetical protein
MVGMGVGNPVLNQFWSLVFLGISDRLFHFGQNLGQEFLSKKKVRGYFFREKTKKAVGASWSHRFFQSKKLTA